LGVGDGAGGILVRRLRRFRGVRWGCARAVVAGVQDRERAAAECRAQAKTCSTRGMETSPSGADVVPMATPLVGSL